MSRIGKKAITVPAGVEVTVNDHKVTVKGPKGTLEREIHKNISVTVENNEVKVTRPNDEALNRSLHGLTRTLINNMIHGVEHEFTRELNLTLGYSHPVIFKAPEGISFDVPNPNTIIVKGIDKELVGQTAADIRTKRPPEVYRGKGIKYAEEVIRRKEGKTGK